MARQILIGHMGPGDAPPAFNDDGLAQHPVDFLGGNRTLRFGIGGAIRTLGKMSVFPTEVGVDLLVLAAMVHAADTRFSRVQTSQDAWTRELSIYVPVSNPGHWRPRQPLLNQMLRFLTGDHWTVHFRARPEGFADFVRRPVDDLHQHGFDRVALFSGGLDSLIGAIDRLQDGACPMFVSHAGEGAVSRPQRDLFLDLAAAYAGNREPRRMRVAVRFRYDIIPGIGSEDTTRGRSFLFFALAAFAGSGLGHPFPLEVPENGLIALNVPLDPVRLGSLSTRTTHPYYIHRWNQLLAELGIPGTVINRYWDKTKGEMIDGCLNPTLLRATAATSLSCAHPSTKRWGRARDPHCGHCVPCIIRQAAFNRGWGEGADPTGYRIEIRAQRLSTKAADGQQVRAFQYAVQRLNGRRDLARLFIHKPGPLLEDIDRLDGLTGVYLRGMTEVGDLLRGVETFSPAAEAEIAA